MTDWAKLVRDYAFGDGEAKELVRCSKGLCLSPATGRRDYYDEDGKKIAWDIDVCDEHGPERDYPHAEEIRDAIRKLAPEEDFWWS